MSHWHVESMICAWDQTDYDDDDNNYDDVFLFA